MYDDLQLEHSSTVDRAAEEIRRALFAGQLAPGTPLREVALSEAMGVGRSTIREALTVLVAEGVAVRVPNKGVAVKELTAEDVHDVSLARALSRRPAYAAGPRPPRRTARRSAMRSSATRGSLRSTCRPGRAHEAHLQIHRAFVGLTGSVRLVAAADALSAEIRLGLAHLDRTRANIADQVSEHRRLVDLVETGGPRRRSTIWHTTCLWRRSPSSHATGHGTIDP